MSEKINEVPATTPNFTTEAAAKLAQLFPEIVADGKINLNTLRALIDEDAEDPRERFGLTWPGKTQAIRAAQTPTTATLLPDKENSVNWDTTQNIFIEGDNLEVLKVLQKHYYSKIKMIYIDPPYNTGNDFVYQDNYIDGIGSYLEMSGQSDDEGKLSTNSESAGRFHSNWLNMMYPRLKLARNLLTNDGAIFISVDDHEQSNLKDLCDQIFGESNFIASICVVNNLKGRSDEQYVATSHEYLLIYGKSEFVTNGVPAPDEYEKDYKHEDEAGRYRLLGLRKRGSNSRREDRPNMFYPIFFNKTNGHIGLERSSDEDYEIYPHLSDGSDGCWRWGRETFTNRLPEIAVQLVSGRNEFDVFQKDYLPDDGKRRVKPKSVWLGPEFSAERGTLQIKALFGSRVFDTPKSTNLVEYCLHQAASEPDSTVLDFFAGSGTTAHAVMALNAEDGGSRKCISVQLPEPTPERSVAREQGHETIADISRERIRRAGAKILADEAEKLDGRADALDVGFRAYKLVDTNFSKWKATSALPEEELTGLLAGMAESADDNARPEALLTEVLLKLGLSLTEQIETKTVAGLEVFSVASGLVLTYLNEHVTPTLDQLRALVALEPARLVILEDAFKGGDELKTNLVQECRTHNVDLWTA
ncbi:site-specific DNA-methyltransferase [Actinomyces vulturis]|uniref:site-specific DNA-methyltransferase n=1 Tax=Actinomyces vulturis TaxID=1857645 RepID=UPI000832A475|nr:site-specific DNA-methyltransferase [Actinomyces vulturis]